MDLGAQLLDVRGSLRVASRDVSAPGAGLTICCGSLVSNQLGWSGFMDSLSLCGGRGRVCGVRGGWCAGRWHNDRYSPEPQRLALCVWVGGGVGGWGVLTTANSSAGSVPPRYLCFVVAATHSLCGTRRHFIRGIYRRAARPGRAPTETSPVTTSAGCSA